MEEIKLQLSPEDLDMLDFCDSSSSTMDDPDYVNDDPDFTIDQPLMSKKKKSDPNESRMLHNMKERDRRSRQSKAIGLLRDYIPNLDMEYDKARVCEYFCGFLNFLQEKKPDVLKAFRDKRPDTQMYNNLNFEGMKTLLRSAHGWKKGEITRHELDTIKSEVLMSPKYQKNEDSLVTSTRYVKGQKRRKSSSPSHV